MKKTVFITGATSGIGLSCAARFAASGCNLVLSGRRGERLAKIAADLENESGVRVLTLNFDVTRRAEVESAVKSLPDEFRNIDVLINNAGLALGLEPFQNGSPDQWDTMIDTNVKGLLYVSKAIAQGMIRRNSGHIINIGSIAGREVYPNGNVYCASKAAVDSLSKAMRIDLLPFGIKVTQIAPGAVETEFSLVRFSGDTERAKAVYKGFEPLHPDDVAEVVHYTASLPPHVNINDLLLMPTAQAAATQVFRKS